MKSLFVIAENCEKPVRACADCRSRSACAAVITVPIQSCPDSRLREFGSRWCFVVTQVQTSLCQQSFLLFLSRFGFHPGEKTMHCHWDLGRVKKDAPTDGFLITFPIMCIWSETVHACSPQNCEKIPYSFSRSTVRTVCLLEPHRSHQQ